MSARARIYTACRDLSWLAPRQAKRLARVVLRARNLVDRIENGVNDSRVPLLVLWGLLEHARTSLLEHVREA